MPKVSVIIPIYKASIEYLDKAIHSVTGQSLKDIEIICVLDGYCDVTFNFLNEIKKSDARIKIIKQTNQGPASARNKAIKMAEGQYIAFMDADDYYPNNDILEFFYNITQKEKVKIAGGKALFENNSQLNPPFWHFKNYNKLFINQIADIHDYQICWGYWCFIFEKNLIISNKLYFPNYRRYQDPPWFLRVLDFAQFFYAADKITYIHRENASPKVTESNKKISDHFKGIEDILKYTNKAHFYNLHTFIYKKFLTYDYKILEHLNPSIFINKNNIANKVLKAVNPEIIENDEENVPFFKDYKTFQTHRYKYNLVDR